MRVAVENNEHSRLSGAKAAVAADMRDYTQVLGPKEVSNRVDGWCDWMGEPARVSRDPRMLPLLGKVFRHKVYCVEQWERGELVAILPLVLMDTWAFGRMLVSLPYVNVSGVVSSSGHSGDFRPIISAAVDLAEQLDVRFLQLRHELAHPHEGLNYSMRTKVNMSLSLPSSEEQLWNDLKSSVRNQVRSARKRDVRIDWGRHDRLQPFYDIFARNMRDLGTPCYSRELFASILDTFPGAEICVAWLGQQPIAAALLLHGATVTEVPTANSLRQYNKTNANMLMYWHLLERAVQRGQNEFDFGRSTDGSSHYRFKKQWGATPRSSEWQYCLRHGEGDGLRPESTGFALAIRAWKKMPVALTRILGPSIIRGIP
jgi:FemAB-related protein (PEP-CTERM system-associated)